MTKLIGMASRVGGLVISHFIGFGLVGLAVNGAALALLWPALAALVSKSGLVVIGGWAAAGLIVALFAIAFPIGYLAVAYLISMRRAIGLVASDEIVEGVAIVIERVYRKRLESGQARPSPSPDGEVDASLFVRAAKRVEGIPAPIRWVLAFAFKQHPIGESLADATKSVDWSQPTEACVAAIDRAPLKRGLAEILGGGRGFWLLGGIALGNGLCAVLLHGWLAP